MVIEAEALTKLIVQLSDEGAFTALVDIRLPPISGGSPNS